MPTFKGKGFTLSLPNYAQLVQQGIRQFRPYAGKVLVSKMRSKIGTQQPGWADLKPSTLARKARHLRGSRKVKQVRMGWGNNTPLLDTARMRNSLRFGLLPNGVEVTADFPMGQHEQDALIAEFTIPSIGEYKLPRRAVMGPSLEESIEPLANELEIQMGQLL